MQGSNFYDFRALAGEVVKINLPSNPLIFCELTIGLCLSSSKKAIAETNSTCHAFWREL
jgi:hypothetical protein